MGTSPRFAICNETWEKLPWPETCRQIARAGYDGVEIAPFTLAPDVEELDADRRAEIRRVAEDAGLAIVGLHWLLVSPPGLHMTTPDAAVRSRTADYLRQLADLCGDLGGSILVLGSPKQRNIDEGTSRDEARARYIEALRPCLDACAARGVMLCLEPLGPQETNFLLTLGEARSLIDEIDHPACRTIFDVKAASTEDKPLPDLLRANADIIAHFHANDANRRAPGFGDTDFVPILKAAREIGYGGWISIEVFDYLPDPDTIATQGLATLRRAWDEAGE
jgi:sugar phosphate isomerase/epimerase